MTRRYPSKVVPEQYLPESLLLHFHKHGPFFHPTAGAREKNSTFVNALIDMVTFPCFSNDPKSLVCFFSISLYIFICHVEQV